MGCDKIKIDLKKSMAYNSDTYMKINGDSSNINPNLNIAWPVKFLLVVWVVTVMFLYLLLFGPPEFWIIAEKTGINTWLLQIRTVVEPYFYNSDRIFIIR